jgi:pimeloyl-ACP methyl ester carboxylesterase
MTASQKLIPSGDLRIWTESFGKPGDPTVLLVMGAWNQGIVWPDDFCTDIAEHGYYVIRYDHRDTGQSSAVDFKTMPYCLDDLTRDAVAVLDGHGVRKAHVVGLSMGGFIGQLLALDYPDRVLTLTLIMPSPDQHVTLAAMRGQSTSGYKLSGPSPRLLEHFVRMRESPPKSVEEAIEYAVESWRIANGEGVPFDEGWARYVVKRTLVRAKSPPSASNHTLAMAASPGRTDRLHQIAAPTLVIHGEHDPLLPLDHGVTLAQAIPGAKLVAIPDMGHMLSPRLCGPVASTVREHLGNVAFR